MGLEEILGNECFWNKQQRRDLFGICRDYAEMVRALKEKKAKDRDLVVVEEPYIPYVPEGWNGVLVVASAQNLKGPDELYRKWLEKNSADGYPELNFCRLYDLPDRPYPEERGMGPWDSRYAQLALKSVFPDINLQQVAMTNAVPWSRRDSRLDEDISQEIEGLASRFWNSLTEYLSGELKSLVLVGRVAQKIAHKTRLQGSERTCEWFFPTSRYFNQRIFNLHDLLMWFPEVKEACEKMDVESEDKQHWARIFYACHAVSLSRAHTGPPH